jgi:hypothetical protein
MRSKASNEFGSASGKSKLEHARLQPWTDIPPTAFFP